MREFGSAGPADLRGARWAVAAMFAANGAAIGTWLPRIPELQTAIRLSVAELGLVLAALPTAGLVSSYAAGPALARWGSRGLTVASGLATAIALAVPAHMPGAVRLAAALALLGAADGVMDTAMNTHGLVVQTRYGRSIINGFHALWSAGAVVGSVASSVSAGRGVEAAVALPFAGVVVALVVVVAWRWLLHDEPAEQPRSTARRHGSRSLRTGAALGILTLSLLFGLLESVSGDWGAVHLATTFDAGGGVAGLGFVAFACTHLVGRLVGDPLVRRQGTVVTTRVGSGIAAAGLALAAIAPAVPFAVAGFALVGLGLSTVVPAVFVAAGRLPGVPAGVGIARASVMGRAGFVLGPTTVGIVAEAAGLRVALGVAAGAAACAALLVTTLRVADTPMSPAAPQ